MSIRHLSFLFFIQFKQTHLGKHIVFALLKASKFYKIINNFFHFVDLGLFAFSNWENCIWPFWVHKKKPVEKLMFGISETWKNLFSLIKLLKNTWACFNYIKTDSKKNVRKASKNEVVCVLIWNPRKVLYILIFSLAKT